MSRTRWRIRATVLRVAVLAGLGAIGLRPAWANPPQHAQRHLTVATYNLYLGADLTPLFSASSPQELIQRAGQIYANVVKTDFPSRAEAIAKLLAANPPDVAGLQEVSLWETGPIGGPLSPSYDFLQLLLTALARHGLTYRPVPLVALQLAYEYTRTNQGKSLSSVTNFLPARSGEYFQNAILMGLTFGF